MQAIVHPVGRLVLRNRIFRAALGRAGVGVHKMEGDGATPAGVLPLRRVLYRLDRLSAPDCAVPIEPVAETDGWCDDPTHRDYNRPVNLPHEARCEELWRPDGLYDVVGVLGWNDAPVTRGHGSAIFLHVARPDYEPTEGCVALALPDLLVVLGAGVTELLVLPAG
jgi:L,D-peptidoglycan transpeptidase YkuD (ErfK/YbiS/YcfS/YnhG family)